MGLVCPFDSVMILLLIECNRLSVCCRLLMFGEYLAKGLKTVSEFDEAMGVHLYTSGAPGSLVSWRRRGYVGTRNN